MPDPRFILSVMLSALLAGCVSSQPQIAQPSRPAPSAPPPMRPAEPVQPVATPSFRVPEVMRVPGLESVIGASASQLERRFGPPRLRVQEGDALKLQFSGEPCVLDVYLYPMSPGVTPSAAHVEARRASDGRHVDRASCVSALRRN